MGPCRDLSPSVTKVKALILGFSGARYNRPRGDPSIRTNLPFGPETSAGDSGV